MSKVADQSPRWSAIESSTAVQFASKRRSAVEFGCAAALSVRSSSSPHSRFSYSARRNTEAKAVFAFESEQLDYDYRDIEQQKKIVADRFDGQGWEVPKLLAHLDTAEDFYFDAMAQIHMDDWSKGRVALVGDAGYCASPLSGQGADLSLVGAYILAGELAAAGGDHTIAFARYRAEMLPMVRACQNIAEGVGKWYAPPSNSMIRMRNLNVRLLPYLPWRGLIGGAP
ncbi:FAD-dependent monooxygenase [Nocardia sp. CA-084685]|uniref:FAD-dependent monooxygenase n=1 Tax=Nocardia sp. CA-084685 TaxID=3239970 RepID=UPI003D9638B8